MSRAFARFKNRILENVARAGISREEAIRRMHQTGDLEQPRCAIAGEVAGVCVIYEPALKEDNYDDRLAYFGSKTSHVNEANHIISLVAAKLFINELRRESASLGIEYPHGLNLGDYCLPVHAQIMETLLQNGHYDIGVGVLCGAIGHAVLAKVVGLDMIYVRAKRHGARIEFEPVCGLERIGGKRVLVIEDDISSGRTMRKVLSELRRFGPVEIGIGLFSNTNKKLEETFMGCKIAYDSAKVHTTGYDEEKERAAIVRLLGALRQ
jgi:hypoxanthine-guanine phosphoribosyltransferase